MPVQLKTGVGATIGILNGRSAAPATVVTANVKAEASQSFRHRARAVIPHLSNFTGEGISSAPKIARTKHSAHV
jgi:hypothetical protein